MRERVQLQRRGIYRQHFSKHMPSIMLFASRRFMLYLGTGFCEQFHRERLLKRVFLFLPPFFFSPFFPIKIWQLWTVGFSAPARSQTQTTAEVFTSTYQQRQLGLCNCQPSKIRRVSSSDGARCSSWHLSHYTALHQPQAMAGCIFLPISVSSACVLLLFFETFWGFTDALSPFLRSGFFFSFFKNINKKKKNRGSD